MLLKDKVAVIYGAGGGIAGGIARAYAKEGARLFLANRSLPKAQGLADELGVDVAQLDVTDAQAVDAFVDGIVDKAGRIDISFNVIGIDDVQQPLMEISPDDFLQPIAKAMRAQFLTTRAAARHMIDQESGVVLFFGGGGSQTFAGAGGFVVALDALESLRRQWAIELEPYGIRIVTLKTSGIPETISPDFADREQITASIEAMSPMRRSATLTDLGAIAAFVASDQARSITNTWINMGYGSMPE